MGLPQLQGWKDQIVEYWIESAKWFGVRARLPGEDLEWSGPIQDPDKLTDVAGFVKQGSSLKLGLCISAFRVVEVQCIHLADLLSRAPVCFFRVGLGFTKP